MARWVEFSERWDYRWKPSSTVAFKAGMKVYLPDAVADLAADAGVAIETARPKDDDPAKVNAPGGLAEMEPMPGAPAADSAALESIRIQAGAEAPDAPGGPEA